MSNLNFVRVEVKIFVENPSKAGFRQPINTKWRRAERCGLLSMASLTTSIFSGVRTVFTPPPFFFSVEPVASKFRTQVLMAWADGTARLRWIPNSPKFTLRDHETVTALVKHFYSKSCLCSSPLLHYKLKRFEVGSKMAIAASASVLLNQEKHCCKIARFTDGPCRIHGKM